MKSARVQGRGSQESRESRESRQSSCALFVGFPFRSAWPSLGYVGRDCPLPTRARDSGARDPGSGYGSAWRPLRLFRCSYQTLISRTTTLLPQPTTGSTRNMECHMPSARDQRPVPALRNALPITILVSAWSEFVYLESHGQLSTRQIHRASQKYQISCEEREAISAQLAKSEKSQERERRYRYYLQLWFVISHNYR